MIAKLFTWFISKITACFISQENILNNPVYKDYLKKKDVKDAINYLDHHGIQPVTPTTPKSTHNYDSIAPSYNHLPPINNQNLVPFFDPNITTGINYFFNKIKTFDDICRIKIAPYASTPPHRGLSFNDLADYFYNGAPFLRTITNYFN